MSNTKKSLLIKMISIIIASLTLGILLLVLDGNMLVRILFIVLGALFIIDGIIGIIKNYKVSPYLLVTSSISIILGIILMFNLHFIINIIIALWFIIFPIIRIIQNKETYKEELKFQLPRIILGGTILLFGVGGITEIVLTILGWTIIVLTAIYLIFGIITLVKQN